MFILMYMCKSILHFRRDTYLTRTMYFANCGWRAYLIETWTLSPCPFPQFFQFRNLIYNNYSLTHTLQWELFVCRFIMHTSLPISETFGENHGKVSAWIRIRHFVTRIPIRIQSVCIRYYPWVRVFTISKLKISLSLAQGLEDRG